MVQCSVECKIRINKPFCRFSKIKLHQPAWLTANPAERILERKLTAKWQAAQKLTHRSIKIMKRCIVLCEQPGRIEQWPILHSGCKAKGLWPRRACPRDRAQGPTCPHGEFILGRNEGCGATSPGVSGAREHRHRAGWQSRSLQRPTGWLRLGLFSPSPSSYTNWSVNAVRHTWVFKCLKLKHAFWSLILLCFMILKII